jgi:hypothetical protein
MKKVLVLAILLGLAVANTASAAIIMTGHLPENAVVNGGLATWTLSFTANAPGGVVAGFAGNLPGNNGFNGAAPNGPLSQQAAGGVLPTPTTDFNALINPATDSQFRIANADILSAVAPFESPTSLGGAFTLNVASRAPQKALVQIVAPASTQLRIPYSFGISEAVGAGSETFNFEGVLMLVPEPASFGLAGMSLLGLLAARRRTA